MPQNVLTMLLLGFAAVAQAQQGAQPPATERTRDPDRAAFPGRDRTRGPFDFWPRELPQPSASTPIKLSNVAQIQTELNLTAEQKQALTDLTKKLSDQQVQLYAETRKRAVALNQEADEELKKLFNSQQLARIEQLRLQREGTSALSQPDVAARLGLSDDQRAKLTKLRTDLRNSTSFGGGFSSDGPSGRSAASSWREATERIQAEMLAVLTPDQKARWDDMQGPKFEFPAPASPFGEFSAPPGTTDRTDSSSRFPSASRARPFELGQLTSGRSVGAAEAFGGPAGPFRYKSTVEALVLTEEQKSRIQIIGTEDADAIGKIRDERGSDTSEKVAQITKATREKLDKVLTAGQQAKLKELTPSRSSFTSPTRARTFELGAIASRSTDPVRSTSMRTVETFYGPAGPFRYKSAVEALALTDEQKAQIQVIGVEDAAAVGKIAAVPGAEASETIAQISKNTRDKIDKVLTEEQRTKLKEMTSR